MTKLDFEKIDKFPVKLCYREHEYEMFGYFFIGNIKFIAYRPTCCPLSQDIDNVKLVPYDDFINNVVWENWEIAKND